ncbi:MAG: lipopolysaccharide transport periplasmic protein LptA [Halieaceae bacterium MED-G27]|jgi:lipopolysaccharide export system protein LptA|nr:lipopolysaccharide transport periplasmic protein LptA [Halieaceae bacterium]OUT65715.1 MAG: lipopolysaccharide transport periplasmic protein LptA [Cellvibrionales bacterium TMED21]PDH35715.1 MAG: lipopolysaccharide transport periplasmic protein LptA [Halieaceae bacterium MED-G27]|tara:strand:+ start:15895 stop:16428 length:534 start_codon:yes stop_codon:yes gene_type:complete
MTTRRRSAYLARAGFFGLLSLLLGPISVHADDAQYPIEIAADSAVREEPSGKTLYRGDVVLTRGSLRIESAELSFTEADAGVTVIAATGSPASLRQKPSADAPEVSASADLIEYHETDERVRLIGNAKITQDGAVITGSTIDYLIPTQRVIAAGSASGDTRERVKVTIPPTSLRENR